MKTVTIYTDGACRGNPGLGGWGALIQFGKFKKEIYGGETSTTNNKMELKATINALKAMKEPCDITLYTDSKYVIQGIENWIHNWKKKNWIGANKKPIKNMDLWKELDELRLEHNIKWIWVKGHSGDPGNETADMLANRGIDEL
tara:strand:- start:75 stop:506 length:432 start_codon:yes stop_codon:yes gene_type:complete